MFNIPSIPTDNFYKFLTISGLAIILYSFYSIDLRTETTLKQHKELNEGSKKVNKEILDYTFKESELNCYTSLINVTNNKEKAIIIDSILKSDTTIKDALKILISNRLRYIDTTRELINQRISTIINLEEVLATSLLNSQKSLELDNSYYSSEIKSKRPIGFGIFLLGIIITGLGLFTWYTKHQKKQDIILNNQLKGLTK